MSVLAIGKILLNMMAFLHSRPLPSQPKPIMLSGRFKAMRDASAPLYELTTLQAPHGKPKLTRLRKARTRRLTRFIPPKKPAN